MLINNSIASPDALIAAGDQISFISKQHSKELLKEEENNQTEQTQTLAETNSTKQQTVLSEQIQQTEQYTISNETTSQKDDFNITEQTEIQIETPSEVSTEEIQQQIPPVSEDANHIIVSINGVWKTIPLENRKKLLFYDMLNYVDIDLEKPQGNIIIKLNGEDASYTATISQGDSIEIAWDKQN